MSDDNKNDAERDNEEPVIDSNSTTVDVSLKCDSAKNVVENEQSEIVDSNGIDSQAADVDTEKHVRDLLNMLMEYDSDCVVKNKKCYQGRKERREALTRIRRKKYEEEVSYDVFHNFKKKFESILQKKKVSEEDMRNKSYDELCKMIVASKSLYEERAKFYRARMAHDEKLDEYFQRLTDLSNNCQFGERRDAVIADQFIMTQPTIFHAFCTEGQKEIKGKKVLKISKQHYDKSIIACIPLNEFYMPSRYRYRSLFPERNSKKVPPYLAEMIRNEIMEKDLHVEWDDIAGLEFPKSIIKESIVWPMIRPDIFTGLRKIPKGILLFGPPGTGKTMIAKCIAAQSKSTFFYVSASTLASKWYGESEQLARALFTIAAEHEPSVIFFDEVDSMLTQRKSEEQEVSRRVKTEFMVQLDGAATKDDARVIFIGATNRPQDLDEAARRRFVKRLYIPLPDLSARQQLLSILLRKESSNLTDSDVKEIATMTEDFSGADIKWLCQDAAMEPLRSIPVDKMMEIAVKDIRPLEMYDFVNSLKRIRPSVAETDLSAMVEWDRLYGSNSEGPAFVDSHFMYS